MDSQKDKSQHVEDNEKRDARGEHKIDKSGATINEKATSSSESETLPGWTIMRPLRMRGLKGKSGASATSKGKGNDGNVSKNATDLKNTATNDSGESPHGIEELETLNEMRSDDELLGEGEEGQPRRDIADQRSGHDANGDDVESNLSGREFKVYKRRWFGLAQMVLLNIVVSWDVSSKMPSPYRASRPNQFVFNVLIIGFS